MQRSAPPLAPAHGEAAPARAALPVVAGALLLLLGVLLPAGQAEAVERFRLVAPAAETTLTGEFTIVVEVEPSDGELIDAVEARLAGPTNRVFQLRRVDPPTEPGPQRWEVDVQPLGQVPMSNGRHRLTVQPQPRVGTPPAFEGHGVALAVPATTELVAAPTGEDPNVVALTWERVAVPDLLGFHVQRRPDREGTAWRTVAELDTDAAAHQDEVEQPGAYRYRIVAVRADGADGEVRGFSNIRGVRTGEDNPGTYDPEPEPEPTIEATPTPTPTAAPQPVDDDPGGAVGRPGPVGAGQVADAEPETATAQTPSGPAPPVTVGQPPPPPPRPSGPTVVPLDDGVFEPLLPISETETELSLTETETAFIDGQRVEGGTLAVLTEEPVDRQVIIAVAAGLLLLVTAGHLRRFLLRGERTRHR